MLDGLGDGFWERVRSHPWKMVREAAAADPTAGRRALARLFRPELSPEAVDLLASHPNTPGRVL